MALGLCKHTALYKASQKYALINSARILLTDLPLPTDGATGTFRDTDHIR